MPIEIPRSLVEFILLGPEDDRRQLQDSPVLGDVWIQFARTPDQRVELLITPYKDQSAATVAATLAKSPEIGHEADIAYLQGVVAAKLTLEELLRFVVPMTSWWTDKHIATALKGYLSKPDTMREDIQTLLAAAGKWLDKKVDIPIQDIAARKRYVALTGLILWARDQKENETARDASSVERIRSIQRHAAPDKLAAAIRAIYRRGLTEAEGKRLVWTVSLNRRASHALTRSVPAVKADAARTLFRVDCKDIVWAVIDSGIDANHRAFLAGDRRTTRIRRSFDFTTIRGILSLGNLNDDKRKERVSELLKRQLVHRPERKAADRDLRELAEGAGSGKPLNWEIVERLVEIDPKKSLPPANHGTHVAGILGASRSGARAGEAGDWADGMCPDINIYDFRVLGPTLEETEFAIVAALQYIRYVNERNSFVTIHGANLSMSIPHDVRNYACGRTPVCNECERLVASGVVVVAAAGNRGYQNFETGDGQYEGYAAFSITDPGNADGVITVGATHRFWPHTYGVSFFSSRGPTGDGRLKPDLVAPGERIRAPLPEGEWGDLDGTSMAAPHVSGAAAMLMSRYSELIGRPRRIKEILCESATDLGREKSFQGHGMLDVLRAFQRI